MIKIKLIFSIIFFVVLRVEAQNGVQAADFQRIGKYVYVYDEMIIDAHERSIFIPCSVNMHQGLIEVLLCRPEGKTHESLLVTHISPLVFNTAMLLLGLNPVNQLTDDPDFIDPMTNFKTIESEGDSVRIFLKTVVGGEKIRRPVEDYILDMRTGASLQPSSWLFRGAVTHATGYVIIDDEVSMIVTYRDPLALVELNEEGKYNDEWFYVYEPAGLVKGQEVTLVIEAINDW